MEGRFYSFEHRYGYDGGTHVGHYHPLRHSAPDRVSNPSAEDNYMDWYDESVLRLNRVPEHIIVDFLREQRWRRADDDWCDNPRGCQCNHGSGLQVSHHQNTSVADIRNDPEHSSTPTGDDDLDTLSGRPGSMGRHSTRSQISRSERPHNERADIEPRENLSTTRDSHGLRVSWADSHRHAPGNVGRREHEDQRRVNHDRKWLRGELRLSESDRVNVIATNDNIPDVETHPTRDRQFSASINHGIRAIRGRGFKGGRGRGLGGGHGYSVRFAPGMIPMKNKSSAGLLDLDEDRHKDSVDLPQYRRSSRGEVSRRKRGASIYDIDSTDDESGPTLIKAGWRAALAAAGIRRPSDTGCKDDGAAKTGMNLSSHFGSHSVYPDIMDNTREAPGSEPVSGFVWGDSTVEIPCTPGWESQASTPTLRSSSPVRVDEGLGSSMLDIMKSDPSEATRGRNVGGRRSSFGSDESDSDFVMVEQEL